MPDAPAMYILDHEGVIRHMWMDKVGEPTIDRAPERLIGQVEAEQ